MPISQQSPFRRRFCLAIPVSMLAVCVLLAAASALSNAGLPKQSTVLGRLSEVQKAQLSEVLHLRQTLGNVTWPGWGQADIPLIVYNERYAFLVGLQNPADGWMKVPRMERRGGPWEKVPGDLFEREAYYRTPIIDPQKTPEGFTVLVGDRWAATFQTREYSEMAFYQGLHEQLPPAISSLLPLRLAWAVLMGKTDAYIASLEHESFHAYQGMQAEEQLAASESLYAVEDTYPFDGMEQAWQQEMKVLVQAARATDRGEALSLARKFLALRAERRADLTAEQVKLEQLREWEEGLAKYAELQISRLASKEAGYESVETVQRDPDFREYAGQEEFWLEQLKEAQNTKGRSGDTRFYYSGNALAVLLDRLMPDWKPRALPGGEYLDDLLEEAVG